MFACVCWILHILIEVNKVQNSSIDLLQQRVFLVRILLAVRIVDEVLIDCIDGGLAKDESADGYHDDTIDHHPMPAMGREKIRV